MAGRKAAPLADVGVILATTLDPARFPDGVRAGVSAAAGPDRSWWEARTALRFATSRRPVVHFDELGALALLAQVPSEAARDNADVAALARVAGTAEDLETLTSTAPPDPSAERPSSSTCTTAASPAGSTSSEGPWGSIRRAHRTHAGPARPHRVAAARRVKEIAVPTGDTTLA